MDWLDQLIESGFEPIESESFTAPLADSHVIELSNIVKSGNAREYYSTEDIVELCGFKFGIIGFDHDKISNMPDAPTITLMGTTLLPEQEFHSDRCSKGWIDSNIREWSHEYYHSLPDELKPYIHSTIKTTHNYSGTVYETEDRLFLPSVYELFGDVYNVRRDGNRYEAFRDNESRIRRDENGNPRPYWTRSAVNGASTHFCSVHAIGNAISNYASNATIRVPLCFLFS